MNFYNQPPVQEACLELQSRYGIDMDLLFFCLKVGTSGGGKMTRGDISQAMEAVSRWQEDIVRPIRAASRRLESSYKSFPEEKTEMIQKSLAQAELDAEKI
ncbi:MAG: TIGR02444 family protein, partial [Bacillota bacterium]